MLDCAGPRDESFSPIRDGSRCANDTASDTGLCSIHPCLGSDICVHTTPGCFAYFGLSRPAGWSLGSATRTAHASCAHVTFIRVVPGCRNDRRSMDRAYWHTTNTREPVQCLFDILHSCNLLRGPALA
ncbi:hypothetical protein RSOL_189780 [Rhizoctonia solani AG-3 Rhs1AP]|uniref:Uncharacterized protein n=1 Tax=Rhizoctonia solani AG-3 Rhs1AP TaxID=1086054 RepID=X8J5X9_9AGAM|nr:hypothetical protein RSOL_189780 [Rhizoctonia solani AG-3 Rhs1AP]